LDVSSCGIRDRKLMSAQAQEEDGKIHALKERERKGGKDREKAEYIRTCVAEGETSKRE